MSPVEAPQFYENILEPIGINQTNLLNALTELRSATRRGAELLEKAGPAEVDGKNGLFMGVLGIALAFLRLDHQVFSLTEEGETSSPDYRKLATERIPRHGPKIPLVPGRLSPLGSGSPLAATVMRIQAATKLGHAFSGADVDNLRDAVAIALKHGHIVPHANQNMGGDEVLNGRAGLLWSILNMRVLSLDEKSAEALKPIFESVPQLIEVIVEAGRQGHRDYVQAYGNTDALPLMWTYKEGRYGLGAVHGMAGILAVLLACKAEELNNGTSHDYFPWIADTVLGLCCARRNRYFASNFWQPEWDKAIFLASERVWKEGLLSKGGSLCHGITGNAWPLLLLHDSCEYDVELLETARRNYRERAKTTTVEQLQPALTGEYFLSRALALLLHARETPPYNASPESSTYVYRMPDRPYSLSEGLAGTICAWADACVAIQARLRKMDFEKGNAASVAAALKGDVLFQELENRKLGFPTLAYHRPAGLL
ncbi:lanC-like protein 3 homolog [Aspergillus udagawae]|uniref:LanC-like protein 3 homolog n=1 Tax=Aspergillus udagawae TaxID=91492 RepID=A0A8H3PF48_9EURO|nr:lanC-like protein 3 homolog [Aspergillus udagawae]